MNNMKKIERLLVKTFEKTNENLYSKNNANNFKHINESVYRYEFLKNLTIEQVNAETEWNRVDALCYDEKYQYLIEFKQYDIRYNVKFPWPPQKGNRKGGAE